MIIAHLFVRKGKGSDSLMCETTATEGMVAPYSAPVSMFEVNAANCPSTLDEIERKAAACILVERPDLELVEVSRPKETSAARPCSSDLLFRRKHQSVFKKLGIIKK